MTKAELLREAESQMAGSSPHTISQFKAIISRFYDFSKGDFTRIAVVRYIQRLEKDGYAAGTRRQHYRVLKRGFDFAKVERPFGKRPPSELPIEVAEWDVERIPETAPDIASMVKAVRDGAVTRDWVSILCLSTVYGLRRVEMLELAPKDFMLKRGVIRIRTAKHGRQREHLIPDFIVPHLEQYPFGAYSEFRFSAVFHRIRAAAGLPNLDGGGWHSIRRSLDTFLLLRLPFPMVRDFLRWKKSSMEMALLYFSPGALVGSQETALGPAEIDRQVFAVHPFLGLWK